MDNISLLDLCILELWGEIDPALSATLHELCLRKSALCWHKCGNFRDHLIAVTRVCVLWGAPSAVSRCALIHSAYGNSYVNLQLFNKNVERQKLVELVGDEAEELTHKFCTVNRQKLIFEDCWELRHNIIPENGISGVDRKTVAYFLFLTIADFSEQWTSWQDLLFTNHDASLNFVHHNPATLWPGIIKPGLYLSKLSFLGKLLSTCTDVCPIPPIFNQCTETLAPEDEVIARDAYWEAVTKHEQGQESGTTKNLLLQAIKHNPFVAEPHLLLAQLHLIDHEWLIAQEHATTGLTILTQWGTPWDKRIDFGGWVAWARVLKDLAIKQIYPKDGWGAVNLGITSEVTNSK
jgi:hypothetical protein